MLHPPIRSLSNMLPKLVSLFGFTRQVDERWLKWPGSRYFPASLPLPPKFPSRTPSLKRISPLLSCRLPNSSQCHHSPSSPCRSMLAFASGSVRGLPLGFAHCLAGDGAGLQSGVADFWLAFDDRRAFAHVHCLPCCMLSGRTGADNQYVIVHRVSYMCMAI